MKKGILINIFIIISFLVFSQEQHQKIRVALLDIAGSDGTSLELRASLDFLKHYENRIRSTFVTFDDIQKNPGLLDNLDVVWFHKVDSSSFSKLQKDPEVLSAIKDFVRLGGGLILSMDAMRYLNVMSMEPKQPVWQWKEAKDGGYGRKLGLHAFRQHPVFDGLHGGAYIYKPIIDMKVPQIGYFDMNMPENAKVLAVDWDYIFLREDTKLVLEYDLGKGKIIAIGAYVHFGAPNYNRKHLDKFMLNTIDYLAGKKSVKAYYWSYDKPQITETEIPRFKLEYAKAEKWPADTFLPSLQRKYATDNYCEVSTDRLLITSVEKGGIEEIWAHPFMALRDYEVGIRFSYEDSIYWLSRQKPQLSIRPNSLEREYKFKRAYLTEVITAPMHEGGVVVHYEYRGVYPAELFVKFKSHFRYMWPYDHKALGDLKYGLDMRNNLIMMQDHRNEFNVLIGSNKEMHSANIGQYEGFKINDVPVNLDRPIRVEEVLEGLATDEYMISGIMKFNLEMNDDLDIFITAANADQQKVKSSFEKLIGDPYAAYTQSSGYYRDLLNSSLSINTPDSIFNEGYTWALIGSDKFFVHTPGTGQSLVAGYASSDHGWDGGQTVSGRPGYAWYFGRDAIWSAFALLDYGDFDKVKKILETFQQYQDLSGKIYHELSTSGIVHYDASDATPLYIILAARYLKHTGDLEFIKKSWPHIHKAIEFCFSTDTDADHLIENTNVGHGWVEGGHLFGSHTSLHLASLWAEAMEESAYMAGFMKKEELLDHYAYEAEIVQGIINEKFYDDSAAYYYHGMLQDGSLMKDETIMPAIPMYFEQAAKENTARILKDFASNAFSSDWGTRIVKKSSDHFNPAGYHTGSVWPLFTGWTALAEYKYGNTVQGYTHITNNLNVYRSWALGYLEEVLNGEEYQASGVCAHQCWSETMVLQPIIEGLIGFEPDATENTASLHPAFPANWDHVSISNLKFGQNSFDLEMKRSDGKTTYWIRPEYQNAFSLDFNPVLPKGTEITEIKLNGKALPSGDMGNITFSELKLKLNIQGDYRIDVKHRNGISVLPYTMNPKPGESSTGLRIIHSELKEKEYTVLLEGKAGNAYKLGFYIESSNPTGFNNMKLIEQNGSIYDFEVIFDKGGDDYVEKKVSIGLD